MPSLCCSHYSDARLTTRFLPLLFPITTLIAFLLQYTQDPTVVLLITSNYFQQNNTQPAKQKQIVTISPLQQFDRHKLADLQSVAGHATTKKGQSGFSAEDFVQLPFYTSDLLS